MSKCKIICRGDDCGTMYYPEQDKYVEYQLDQCIWMGGAYDYISSYYEITEEQAHTIPQRSNGSYFNGKFITKGRSAF